MGLRISRYQCLPPPGSLSGQLMLPAADGAWVRYVDFVELTQAAAVRITKLEAALKARKEKPDGR